MANDALPVFPNYMQLRERSRISIRFWNWARVATVIGALIYAAVLFILPVTGLMVFWKLTVPILPVIILFVPGLWRNVCPLAASNQTPRVFGFSLALNPPAWFKEYGYVIGMVLFFLAAASRKWLFNYNGPATALLILSAMSGAFVGGYLFKGKSGWCSSICPLYPVQRLYNQTPFITLPNAHCTPCVGCTKNCYDFNPAVAYLADLYDDDRYHSNYRKFFAASMPGFILAYFTLPDPTNLTSILTMYLSFLVYMVISAGTFFLLDSFIKVSANKLTALYAAAAFNLFYFFGLPRFLGTASGLLDTESPNWLAWILQGFIAVLTIAWVMRTYRKEPLFLGQLLQGEGTRVASGAASVLKKATQGDKPEITFMPGEVRILADMGRTLLEIAEANGQKIEAGCRMGMCGADPVVVLSGMENLPPKSADEISTLERLGLGENCRMACMCRIKGPVSASLNVKEAAATFISASQPRDYDKNIKSVVVIGTGIAGVTAADYVRRNHPECEIHLIGREKNPLYNRMAITRLIYGRSAMSGLYLQPDSWYEERNITSWLNTHAINIDRDQRIVQLATGEALPYDRLILASGSTSFVPPIPGYGMAGTFGLREAEEAMEIRSYVQKHRSQRAVVAGGGLLGIEAAYALHKIGLSVAILERGQWLLRRQLDERSSHFLEQYLEALGLEVVVQAETASLSGNGVVSQVTLKDGRVLPCDLFLVAMGIVPNVDLARKAGLEMHRGVIVNSAMQTSAPEIFAAGDVCEFNQQVPGLWPVAVEQARIAAINALGGQAVYHEAAPITALKVVGVDLTSIGRFEVQSDSDIVIALEETEEHHYRKLVIADGKIVGAILLGYPFDTPNVTLAVKQGVDVSDCLDALRAAHWEVLEEKVSAS